MIATCKLCGKDAEHSVRPSGAPASRCKACQREYSKQHYKAHKPVHNARRYENQKRYRQERQRLINELKSNPCADCGIPYPPYVMDFDHVSDDKLFSIAGHSQKSRRQLLEEIAKCEVVCSNCHRERTHQRRGGGA